MFDFAGGEGGFHFVDNFCGGFTEEGFIGESRLLGFDVFCQALNPFLEPRDFRLSVSDIDYAAEHGKLEARS